MQGHDQYTDKAERVFRTMCVKLEEPLDLGLQALYRINAEMPLDVEPKPYHSAKTDQGQLIYSLMYKAEHLHLYLLGLEQALIARKQAGLARAQKPSWRRRSMALHHQVVDASPAYTFMESDTINYEPTPPLTVSAAPRTASSMSQMNKMAMQSLRRHLAPAEASSDALGGVRQEAPPVARLRSVSAAASTKAADYVGNVNSPRSGSRSGQQINFTTVGLHAIEDQRRMGQLQMEKRKQANDRAVGYFGAPLDDPYANPYWDEPLVCKAQKTPARASEVVVLMATTPRKRFYVGDHIPVQLEVRNHTTKTIPCMAMSLVLITYGVVMGYKDKDKKDGVKTRLRHEKSRECFKTDEMVPFGFPIKGRFKSNHSLKFKLPFQVPPATIQPDVLPDGQEFIETHYFIQIRIGDSSFGGPVLQHGPFLLEERKL